jgi:hypothetical protein
MYEIEIIGNEIFNSNTLKALDIIKKAPAIYETVTKYIGIIKQTKTSGMAAYENPPVFYVGDATSQASSTWYASCIVHDSYHSKLYHDYLDLHGYGVPYDVWAKYDAEMKCLEFQIGFLKEIKAPQSEINHAKSFIGGDWWSSARWW